MSSPGEGYSPGLFALPLFRAINLLLCCQLYAVSGLAAALAIAIPWR
jgi:hypothetical protein